MQKELVSQCRPLLESLNANYGRGNVGSVHLSSDGKGRFEQLVRYSQSNYTSVGWRSFSILHTGKSLTVFALRHQKSEVQP